MYIFVVSLNDAESVIISVPGANISSKRTLSSLFLKWCNKLLAKFINLS